MSEEQTNSIDSGESDQHVVCPDCGGEGCSRCGGAGYVLRDSLTAAEIAALRYAGVSRTPMFLLERQEEEENCVGDSGVHFVFYAEPDDAMSVSS